MSSSPFIPSSFTYGDLPYGGSLTPIIMAPRVPASTDILPQGYLWLSDQTLGFCYFGPVFSDNAIGADQNG